MPTLHELLDLVFRWIHLIAGIMWVGNSMLFNWLDRNLVTPESGPRAGLVGEIWMVHSGGFYQIEKKFLSPSGMPKLLHWFKWQSYTTWLTGIALLIIVYYTSSTPHAVMMGVGFIVVGFVLYDVLWRVVGKNNVVGVPLMLALLGAMIWGLTHHFGGRVAFIHVGALFGTIMAGNVFFHIIPSQRELVAATVAGREQDPAIAYRAKQRSIHNNYLTFPLLFTMFSNHFGIIYDHPHNAILLTVLFVGGAGARHFMNIRFTFKSWLPFFFATIATTLLVVYFIVRPTPPPSAEGPKTPVEFATVQAIIHERCQPCHSAAPSDTEPPRPPEMVQFDNPSQIKQWAPRIQLRAAGARTMPFNNKTKMTDAERDTIQRWFDEGAVTE